MNAMEHGNEFAPELPVDVRVVRDGDAAASSHVTDQGGAARDARGRGPTSTPSSRASRRRAAGGSS